MLVLGMGGWKTQDESVGCVMSTNLSFSLLKLFLYPSSSGMRSIDHLVRLLK